MLKPSRSSSKRLRRQVLVLVGALALMMFGASAPADAQCQDVTIRALLADPEGWLHQNVCVEGFVREMESLPTQPNFVWYKLYDAQDNSIWVKRELKSDTDYPPKNTRYKVTGKVERNTSRVIPTTDIILLEAGGVASPLDWVKQNLLLAVLIGVFVVLLIALLLVLVLPSRSRTAPAPAPAPAAATGAPATGGGPIEDDLMTPIYTNPPVGGDVLTPIYYGHVMVEECSDAMLVGKAFDLSFPGNRPEAILGRGSQCDIRIQHKYLSRRHMGFQRRDGEIVARRLPKAKDATVDSAALGEGEAAIVNNGSILTLPGIALRVHLE